MINNHSVFPEPGDKVTWEDLEQGGTYCGLVEKVMGNDLLVSSSQGSDVCFRFVSVNRVTKVVKPLDAVKAENRIMPAPNIYMAAEMLWVMLANVSEGDWSKQSPEWQAAAQKWRNYYFASLPRLSNTEWEERAARARYDFNQNRCVCFGPPGQCIMYPREKR